MDIIRNSLELYHLKLNLFNSQKYDAQKISPIKK